MNLKSDPAYKSHCLDFYFNFILKETDQSVRTGKRIVLCYLRAAFSASVLKSLYEDDKEVMDFSPHEYAICLWDS
jgi:hypothetical protein